MYVNDLTLEITRRCNMRCAHCMRGAPQRLDMTEEVIRCVFRQIDSIGTLSITGGEPSLKPELIHEIWQQMVWQKVSMGYFYVVTNGRSTYKRQAFLEALDKLEGWSDEKELCCMVVSQDQFHKWDHEPSFRYFHEALDDYGEWFSRDYIKLGERKDPIINVIAEGRGVTMGTGNSDIRQQEPWKVTEYNGEMSVDEESIAISANGNVTSSCDMSFARIDKEHKGNILETPLRDIIEGFCEREKDEQLEEVAA